MSPSRNVLQLPSLLMYLANWPWMHSSTVTGTSFRNPKKNFPALEHFTKLWWCSLDSSLSNIACCWMELHLLACMISCSHAQVFHIFDCFWNQFFDDPFTSISYDCCLERISKRPTRKLIFFNVKFSGFLSYPLHRTHVKFFKLNNCRWLFFTNFPARSMSVSDIQAAYLVGVRLILGGVLHGVELLLWHSPSSRCDLISSRNLIK